MKTGEAPKNVAVTFGILVNAVANVTDKVPVPFVVFDPDAVIVPGPVAPEAPTKPVAPLGPVGPVVPIVPEGPVGPVGPNELEPDPVIVLVLR